MRDCFPEIQALREQIAENVEEHQGDEPVAVSPDGQYVGLLGEYHESLIETLATERGNSDTVLGMFYEATGEVDKAEAVLRKAVANGKEVAILVLANLLLERLDFEGALSLANKVKTDNFFAASRIEGIAKYELGLVSDSLSHFSEGLRERDGVCGRLLGEILEDIGEIESAIIAYRIGAELGEESCLVRLELLRDNANRASDEHFDDDDLYPQDDSDAPSSTIRVDKYEDTDSLHFGLTFDIENEMIRFLKEEIASGNADAAVKLGAFLHGKDDIDGAKEAFQRGIELGSGESALLLALICREIGESAAAVKNARLALSWGSLDALLFLSTVLSDQGEYDEAIQLATRAVEVGLEGSNTELGRLLVNTKRYEEAAEVFDDGIESREPQSAIFLGKLLEHYDYFEDAIEAYKAGAEMGDSESARLAAILMESNGDPNGARKYFELSAELSE